jgi:uncharacterized protein (TIGR00661 family)
LRCKANGKVNYFKTFSHLNIYRFYKDIVSYDDSKYDVVISDYEPVSAQIARRNKIPSIGIGHHYAFLHKVPIIRSSLFSYILKKFAPVDYSIGLHWHHFNQPVLPPIVPNSLKIQHPINDKILVYPPFEDKNAIAVILRKIKAHQFYIYNAISYPYNDGNLNYRPYSRHNFLSDLSDCNGVICNAGFELPSEALHLGKKILVKPLIGQIEQESNALALSQLNLANAVPALTLDIINEWIKSPSNNPMNYPNVAEKIADWINCGVWTDNSSLVKSAWC